MESLMKYLGKINRCASLYRGARLEGTGLGSCQLLYILKICQNPGISQEKLAGLLMINKSNVTRQMAALEQSGFIRRVPRETDRRVMEVFPTEKAERVYPRVREVFQEWNRRLMEGLSDEEQENLISMLDRIQEQAVRLAREAPPREVDV